jgi:peptide/nickel transport system substrate-binding protein
MGSFGRAVAAYRVALGAALALILVSGAAEAQKSGGILRIPNLDSPASMSILEEATVVSEGPMMPVFNNLVLFDQHVAQNSLQSIVPDLATSWSWNDDKTQLKFVLRQGVTWHDGKPFTAADVRCTWDLLLGKAAEKLRVNPRKSWYRNLDSVTTNGGYEATFQLKRPQPSFIALLASGWSPVYPCHVPPAQMRQHPIGTGPFKFVEFKPNESIKVARNPDYWKPGLPYLDGIEYTVIRNTSTAVLTLAAGKLDRTWPGIVPIALMREIQGQAPQITCEINAWNIPRLLIINRDKPPFDNPELRRALALTIDRKAFIDILSDGQGDVGATMLPAPEGVWSVPPEMLKTFPGHDPDIAKNRAEARKIMEKLGYGANNRLSFPLTSRNVLAYRDPSVLMIDQLKEIYIDATLDLIDTTQWYPRVMRKDYGVGLTVSENSLAIPTSNFTKTTCAAPSEIIPAIVTLRSTSWSTNSQVSRMSKNGGRSSGRSNVNWPKMERGRRSTIRARPIARILMSKISRSCPTVTTTVGGSRTFGSTVSGRERRGERC